MNPKVQGKASFSILLIVFVAVAGCTGIAPVTPSLAPASTRTPSPIPTGTDTATPDDIATSNFIETASVGALVSTVEPYTLAQYPSPDGKWNVEVVRYECADLSSQDRVAYEQIRLVDLSDGAAKVVDDQRQNCGGLGAFGFNGLYWSPSARYFYYNDSREGQPDGGCGNYLALPMYRLDTDTKEALELDGGFLSPDKTKLASWRKHEIVIWDLDKGEIARVPPRKSDLFNGRMWWSQKSASILFLQTEFQCAPNYGKSYITSLDVANLSQSPIAEYETTDTGVPPTPLPAGVFVLSSYSPLVMEYDPALWQDESHYATGDSTINYLQAKWLGTCAISVQKRADLSPPHSSKIVRIGRFNFTIVTLEESPPDFVSLFYLADQFISGYDLRRGAPVLEVGAVPSEWAECKIRAEEVLSTLHPPSK